MKILLFLFMAANAYAAPYYEVLNSTTNGTSTMTISGYIGVAASSTTPTTFKFRIDGPGGYIQFPDGTQQTTAQLSTATYALTAATATYALTAATATYAPGYAQLAATQTFTGTNTFTPSKLTFTSEMAQSSCTTISAFTGSATYPSFVLVPGSTICVTSVGTSLELSYSGNIGSTINQVILLAYKVNSGTPIVATTYFESSGSGRDVNGSFTRIKQGLTPGLNCAALYAAINSTTNNIYVGMTSYTSDLPQFCIKELR